jgi:outer membrane protein insertion porin family
MPEPASAERTGCAWERFVLSIALVLAWCSAAPPARATVTAVQQQGQQQDPAPSQADPAVQGPPALPTRKPGALPEVVSLTVEGEERFTEAQILSVLGQKIGSPFDPVALDAGIKRLWSSFRVMAQVFPSDVEGGLGLRVWVEELPADRDPRFLGNVDVSEKKLREWALLQDKAELYLHEAGRVRQRLLDGYRKEGYYHAEVNILSRPREGPTQLPDVIFEIREGPKVRVRKFVINGAESMPDKRFLYFFKEGLSHLASRELWGPTLFNWFGERFVEEKLQADLLAMRNVYRDRGWLDAVVELERLEFNADRSRVTIHVLVDEGPRYKVSKLSIKAVEWRTPKEGAETLDDATLITPEAELLALCKLTPGAFYERTVQQRDASALRQRFDELGRIQHASLPRDVSWSFLEPEFVFDPREHTVEVTYRVTQGAEVRIREVLFAGPVHTRDRVLRREMSVEPGQRANLREIERSVARIQATRYFSDEYNRINHRDPYFRFVPVENQPGLADLEVVVAEGRVIDLNIAGGVDSDNGAFAVLTTTMRNFDVTDVPDQWSSMFTEIYRKEAFHGAGQLVELELAPGTEVSRFRIHLVEPDIFRTHLRPTSLDIDLRKQLRRFVTHDEDRFEKQIRFGRKLTFDIFVALGLRHADVQVSDLDSGGVPLSLQDQEDRGDAQIVGPTLTLSTRSLDNLLVPRNGYEVRFSSGYYDEALASDFEYWSNELRGDLFLSVGMTDEGIAPVLHLELGAGAAQPFGDDFTVPFSERYFIGGARSLRGFDFRGIGPFDPLTGDALGGETFFTGTVEFLYPLHSIQQPGSYQRIEALRGGVFVDFGLLNQEAWQVDFDDLRVGAGISLGLAYPLPLQLNFGYPVRRFDGDDRETFSFTFGFR